MQRRYAILGQTLGHTMSPPIHKALFELKGREFSYEVIELEPSELGEMDVKLNELKGVNVTIPYKVKIIDFLDELGETAKRYNSVNCIDCKDGKRIGYNTDCVGFLEAIRAMEVNLSGEALLIGCGGVGRMMAIEAALAGARLTIAVLESDLPLAEQTLKEIKVMKPNASVKIVLNTEIDAAAHYDLLMNASPVGMYPKVDACPVSDEVIRASDAVFDVVYNPGQTQLLKKAKEYGKRCAGGMAMLVWQAVKAHEIWDGDSYTDEEIDRIIESVQRLV
ncbi:MAG: shikimate dehydrogenase [Ruminococcus sp.]|nr:shikimate dehydrogenase [Ruminococcus sp.]